MMMPRTTGRQPHSHSISPGGKCLPEEHLVQLHPLDFQGLDRAGRVEMPRVLQTLKEMDRHDLGSAS